jgi:DNA gyrase subunit A
MLVTDAGKIIRMAIGDISVISRNTQGVKLIDMEAGERLVSAARLLEQEDVEDLEPENGDEDDPQEA